MISKLKAYFHHAPWMKPMRSAGLLGIGKSGRAAFMLVAMALTARTLGVAEFGTLVLIHSLITAIAKISCFQTWQALVHYGMKALEGHDTSRLVRIIKFSALLDILTALIAFGIVWIVSGPAVIKFFGLDPALSSVTQLYGSVIMLLVLSSGSADGILQLFDRFDRIAWHTIAAPLIRCLGAIYLFITSGSFFEFLVLWYIAEAVSAMILITMGALTLKERMPAAGFLKRCPSLLKPEPGIWRYIGGTQLASTLDLSNNQLPVLLVGGVLGPVAAGLYRVAKEFASVLLKPAEKLFGRAFYPDLARLSAQNDVEARRQMVIRTAPLIGGIAFLVFMLFVVFGHQLIRLTAGPDFVGAYATMIWLCAAGVIGAFAFALEPLLIAAGFIRQAVLARAGASAIFIPLLYFLLQTSGIIGAGVASFLYTVLTSLFMMIAGRGMLKKDQREAPALEK